MNFVEQDDGSRTLREGASVCFVLFFVLYMLNSMCVCVCVCVCVRDCVCICVYVCVCMCVCLEESLSRGTFICTRLRVPNFIRMT